ncbi:MAG: DUF5667 domain-containing protein [Chloroflexota bacterium]
MSPRFEDILAQCIDDVKAGRCGIEDCLAKYPSMRSQLEPLLRIASGIQPPLDAKPSPEFRVRARARLMERIRARQSVTKGREPRYNNQIGVIPPRRRFSMIAIVVAIALAVCTAGGGTVYASQDSLPGDVLYPVKLGTEQVWAARPGDDVAKAERALGLAGKRVEEMTALAEKGRAEDLSLAEDKYDAAMNTVVERIEAARGKGLDTAGISELVAASATKQLGVLDTVYDQVPSEATDPITKAGEACMNGLGSALIALAGETPVTAMELALAAMDGRLDRAVAQAEEGNVEAQNDALQQFEEMAGFGEEISTIAQETGEDVAAVEELVATATTVHLEVLAGLLERAPESAKAAIERAIEQAAQGYDRAAEALEGLETPIDIPPKPSIPDTVPADPGSQVEDEDVEAGQSESGSPVTPGPPGGTGGRP